MIKRFFISILEILVWIDKGAALVLTIPFYIVFGHPHPETVGTISSIVGFYAMRGYPWALRAEWFLDRLFFIFEGCELGHCRKYHK